LCACFFFFFFFFVSVCFTGNIGSYKSFIHLHGTCLVHDRSHPLLLLRLQPPRDRVLCPFIPPVYHFLYPIPCRRILRGLPHLRHSPRVVARSRLAGMGSGNVETNRLFPGSAVLYLVAMYVLLFPSIYPQLTKILHIALYVLYTYMVKQRRKVLRGYKSKGARDN